MTGLPPGFPPGAGSPFWGSYAVRGGGWPLPVLGTVLRRTALPARVGAEYSAPGGLAGQNGGRTVRGP